MKFCVGILLLAMVAFCRALPMTNEDDTLVSLDSIEHAQPQPPRDQPHMIIAPKPIQARSRMEVEERASLFDTIVEELRAAGVHTSEKKDLQTLSYKDLSRLLALWHLTQARNFYEANENRAPQIDSNDDDNNNRDDKQPLQQKPLSG